MFESKERRHTETQAMWMSEGSNEKWMKEGVVEERKLRTATLYEEVYLVGYNAV